MSEDENSQTGPARKKRGSYSVGRSTRTTIIRGATQLLSMRGYYGFSLRDLAEEIGVSHPTVMYHFPTKDALVLNVIEAFEEAFGIFDVEVVAAETEDGTPGDPILEERGAKVSTMNEWIAAHLRLAAAPDNQVMTDLDRVFTVESVNDSHPAHDHFSYRVDAMLQLLEKLAKEMPDYDPENPVDTRRLVERWYGMVILGGWDGERLDSRELIIKYLAFAVRELRYSAEQLLALGSMIPRKAAAPFQQLLVEYSSAQN